MLGVHSEQLRGQAVCINRHADYVGAQGAQDGEGAGVRRRFDDDGVACGAM